MSAPMIQSRAYLALGASYLVSRVALYAMGLRFSFSLDWMWLADAGDLRGRLLETLYYFHAFPPVMNLLTGLVLKVGEAHAATVAQAVFLALGVVFVNALFYLARAIGLTTGVAFAFALTFSLIPASVYFEHVYLYEWPVAVSSCVAAVLFHKAMCRPSFRPWLGFFAVCAAVALTRSTFHLLWVVLIVCLAASLSAPAARRTIVAAALIPVACVASIYLKNLLLFGDFAASTFGPASYTLVTVAQLPKDVRDSWVGEGRLSAYAAISVYSPPREYARFFATADRADFPPQLNRLEHRAVKAANFNHWWLLEVHRTRRADVLYYLRHRPWDYLGTVGVGLRDFFSASTTWHPRDGMPASPHFQHRQVLGAYERWFNRVVHGAPKTSIGIYVVLPLILGWSVLSGWRGRHGDPATQARGALLLYCAFQITYVAGASSMLTSLESSRYRFQIEWAIWLLAACMVVRVSRALARGRGVEPRRTGPSQRRSDE